jgi:ATP-dependent RNA helicase DDX60
MILEGWDAARQVHRFQKAISSFWRSQLDENATELHTLPPKQSGIDIEEWLSIPAVKDALTGGSKMIPESWFLAVHSVSVMLSAGADETLCSIFLLHVLIIKHLALSQRRLPLIKFDEDLDKSSNWGGDSESGSESVSEGDGDFDRDIAEFLATFAETATKLLANRKWAEVMLTNSIKCNLADLMDGRLFRIVLQASFQDSLVSALPLAVRDDWSLVSEMVFATSGKVLSLNPIQGRLKVHELGAPNDEEVGELAVMPFSNSSFDKHLACIHITADASLPARLTSMKLYRETTHWHNRKPLISKQNPQLKISKWKNPLRLNQFYMAEMTAYAASLTGAKGKALKPETITLGVKQGKAAPQTEDFPNWKKGAKKATTGLTKAQKIVADNVAKKGGEELDKAFKAWTTVMKDYDDISSNWERYLRAKAYLDALEPAKFNYVEADVNLYLIQTLLAQWAKYCKAERKDEGYHVVALIWTLVRATCSSKAISNEISQLLGKVCTILSIGDAMSIASTPNQDRKLSFQFKSPAIPQTLHIDITQVEFQLLHVGPYMDRLLDAKPDSRVSTFVPDGWQRKVLDELDANHSVFVVAPTSAGKTFISFYAMEQVLRADNDGVLVYVAPTKALVNQIAAEVQARFSKTFPQAGKSVWAIHTRDYRVNNSTGCQVLVTVPHILQIMLLAPTNAKSWAPRVKRIIFDEIHSIGQAEDGVVWEQLLLLAPCPIIALSATVGNPTEFSDWLAETQKASGTQLTMIQHSTRYSDLRKYLYEPPLTFEFTGLGKSHHAGLGLDGVPGLTHFHPVASLVDKSRGMPDDLALEPRDCLLLWKAMNNFQTDKYKMPSVLDPSNALPSCIKKADILKWERDLKSVLLKWMNAGDHESPFEKVVLELSPTTSPAKRGVLFKSSDAGALEGHGDDEIDANDLRATTLPLLYQLHQRQALPAIFFNYDRSGCEDIAKTLLNKLKAAENLWKEGKDWKRKLEEWAKWKVLKDKKAAKKPLKVSKKKRGDNEDDTEKTSKVYLDLKSKLRNLLTV